MSSTQRGRRAWETFVLLVLAIIIVAAIALNLANLEPAAEPTPLRPPPPSGRAVANLPDGGMVAVLWSFSLVLLVLIVLLLFRRRKTTDRRLSPWGSLLPSVLGIVLLIVLLASVPRSLSTPGNQTATADGAEATAASDVLSLSNGYPVEVLLLLLVFGPVGWILYRTRWGAGPPGDHSTEARAGRDLREAATDAVRETIRELEIGADVRTTILACFQRFGHLLRARGMTDQEAFTAREMERLAVRTFAFSRDATASLTSLFEEARYSVHPLGEIDRERAIESLDRIRTALEA